MINSGVTARAKSTLRFIAGDHGKKAPNPTEPSAHIIEFHSGSRQAGKSG
jgi:hypothetical protein